MPIDKMDKEIIKKLKDREYTPSSSAWERLSTQLDEHKVRKSRRRFQIASAASILLLLGLSTMYFFKSTDTPLPQEVIVNTEIDKTIKEKELQIESIPEFKEELVADNEEIIEKNTVITKDKVLDKSFELETKLKFTEDIAQDFKNETQVTEVAKEVNDTTKLLPKVKSNTRIKVNSEDLLYAVTHTEEEVKEYYAKHKVNREEVFETIKLELKKSNLSVDPNTILAEIERNIDDEEFKGNFMQKLKVKISDLAVAFAERNK